MPETNKAKQELLYEYMHLRYPAVAVKLVEEDESIVPADAMRPKEHTGHHLGLCQALALARREDRTVYMRKEDHWCWSPLISFGMVPWERGTPGFNSVAERIEITDREKGEAFLENLPRLPMNKYKGLLLAPLDKAGFVPDITLVYCKNHQLLKAMLAIKSQTGVPTENIMTPLDSCIFSIIPPLQDGNYRVTLPDPGELARALTPEDDIILTIPRQRDEEFYKGVQYWLDLGARGNFNPIVKEDFQRPAFYNFLFQEWGLDTDKE